MLIIERYFLRMDVLNINFLRIKPILIFETNFGVL